MYNLYSANQKQQQLTIQQSKQQKIKSWISRYYNKVQPHLLENYDKRINTFIRKMEEKPLKLHLQQLQSSNLNKLFRNVYQKDSFVGDQSFKFRDKEDWKSLLTPMERLDRKNNMKLFQQKYGNAQIAFRSIGSQSEYKSSSKNEFRSRNKNKQINPPMKYTYKVIKNTHHSLDRSKKTLIPDDKRSEASQSNLKRTNTNNSVSIAEDDIKSEGISLRHSNNHTQHQGDYMHDEPNTKQQKKLHFRKLIDLELSMQDPKNKQKLKQMLIKCGVYRRKGKRVVNQQEADQFQTQF